MLTSAFVRRWVMRFLLAPVFAFLSAFLVSSGLETPVGFIPVIVTVVVAYGFRMAGYLWSVSDRRAELQALSRVEPHS